MAYNPVRWFEIYVQDVERAKAFYEQVFQVRLQRLGSHDIEMWGFPGEPGQFGASGSLVHMPGVASGGNSTIVYFGCQDCAVEAARVVAAGGKLFRDKTSIGEYGYIVLAIDPDGNMIGLHSQK